jgi:hypothetical protein
VEGVCAHYDLFVECWLTATRNGNETSIGEVFIESVIGVDGKRVVTNKPEFSAIEASIAMTDGFDTTVSLEAAQECSLNSTCAFRNRVTMVQSHEVTSATNRPAGNATSRIYFSFTNEPSASSKGENLFRVQKNEELRSYTLLEVLASLFSALSVLILVYHVLMGDARLQPMGWVQRYATRGSAYVYANNATRISGSDAHKLQNMLYSLYVVPVDGCTLDQVDDDKSIISDQTKV